jgi:hypothetical protein
MGKRELHELKRMKEVDGLTWEEIAKSFPGRSAGACRIRYDRNVNEKDKRTNWTKEDDVMLRRIKNEDEDGIPWGEIAGSFPGRSASVCQSRYSKMDKGGGKRVKIVKPKNVGRLIVCV